jgi:hypothetical protein
MQAGTVTAGRGRRWWRKRRAGLCGMALWARRRRHSRRLLLPPISACSAAGRRVARGSNCRTRPPGWIEQYTAEFRRVARGVGRDGWARRVLACFGLVYAAGMLARRFGIVPWSQEVIRGAVLRCWENAMRAVATPETRAAEAAERVRQWIVGAKRVATVGKNFDPEKVDGYEVIHDRDRGEPVALVQRDRLVAVAGGEAVLAAVLDHMKRNGWLLPNRDTGAVTRQKRFDGTAQKLRFVYFRRAFLG